MFVLIPSRPSNIKPIDPTGLLLVDDEDCPNVEGKGGNKDGKVGNGEGDGDAVHDGGLLAHQAQFQISPQQHRFPFKLHSSRNVALKCPWRVLLFKGSCPKNVWTNLNI